MRFDCASSIKVECKPFQALAIPRTVTTHSTETDLILVICEAPLVIQVNYPGGVGHLYTEMDMILNHIQTFKMDPKHVFDLA